ncbi:MAG TPA: Crp/Fnr family transcriptional regulator [Methylomusa anaerophila]|uniref:cAMP receptor protein n=1 Tax=Methylomusa anaerophila TaxID=1930071 RepID=A0A348AG52_9FIRM|nr:Crp/Fnr family transcriptional regulator [Methylomusa anaerophila]BBB90050.1 cAMP receptor protein [Methylomusa anaerophila]HML88223.1 Crp/Fnr family transcriptional regulator [Methylomusa anaerophila]
MTNRCMKDLDIFSALGHIEREQVGELALKRIYHKNEPVFSEGEEADAIYLIKTGRVRLYKISEEGKEFTLDYLKAEDIFGEATFFENAVHTMNAVAMEDTFICCCTKELFVKLLNHPQTALKIVQHFGKKVNEYTEHMSRIAFKDVRGRVLDVLYRLAESYGKQTGNGLTIALDLTHQEIGSLVNASRVMVTNVLSELRKENLVHIDGHRITLPNEGRTKYQNRVI